MNVLFEIGTEELPATNLADIFEHENPLEIKLRKVLEEKRLSFEKSYVWATPRRLVFVVEGVSPKQSPKNTFTKILSKEEAYDSAGQPTEKLLTILKHRKSSLAETVIQPHQDKDTVFIRKTEPSSDTAKILPEVFRALVKSLPFPKNMKWDKKWEDGSDLYFPRPIRNFLCLYGGKPVKGFKIAGIPVTDKTFIFSKSKRRAVPVRGFESYFNALKKNGVILDPRERKAQILKGLEAEARRLGGRLYDDPFLLNEVNFLVEAPNVLSASFDKKFLELPQEVLAVSMARKQRIFGVETLRATSLLPVFIAVLDGKPSGGEKKIISKNIENILHAKLKDSLFFYNEDLKVSLAKKREELKHLIFLKGAGSMLEKSERLVSLAKFVKTEPGLAGEERRILERAAFLCKSDLLTLMVGEFPELQGIVGKYYALANGEEPETAAVIGEQYLPRTAGDKLPVTLAGGVLSMLDKIDLITACFGLGLEPSSSLDPYGLRRSATAVVKIALERKLDFSLAEIILEDKKLLGAYLKKDKEQGLLTRLEDFFKDRFKAVLIDLRFREDLVNAVFASWDAGRFYPTFRHIHKLSEMLTETHFSKACKVVERTVNILKGNKEPLPEAIDPSIFTEDLERRVFERYRECSAAVFESARSGDFKRATSLYAEAFFDILNEFFEKVFVYAEDLRVRKNRLALLKTVKDLYTKEIADLSKIRL